MIRQSPRVVAVSNDAHRDALLDALTCDDTDYGVIVVESIGGAYSRIKEVVPQLVILFCAIDDDDACRLLSMLKTDVSLSDVPVATFATRHSGCALEGVLAELLGGAPCLVDAIPLN